MTVHVKFRDVLDLVPQSTVKVNDVTVGKVTDVDARRLHRRGHRCELRDDVELPDNAVAEIRQTSLLGEKFVSLAPPTDDPSAQPARGRRRDPARRAPAATRRSRRSSVR